MIKRQLAIFLIVGVITVIIDFTFYSSLVRVFEVNIDASKAAGFLSGTLFSYFANKFWTFNRDAHASGSVWRFGALYAATLITNIYVNALMIEFFNSNAASIQLSFILATAVSATLNFLGMKYFVFRKKAMPEKI